jgi:hypothetical protein
MCRDVVMFREIPAEEVSSCGSTSHISRRAGALACWWCSVQSYLAS